MGPELPGEPPPWSLRVRPAGTAEEAGPAELQDRAHDAAEQAEQARQEVTESAAEADEKSTEHGRSFHLMGLIHTVPPSGPDCGCQCRENSRNRTMPDELPPGGNSIRSGGLFCVAGP